MTTKKTRRRSPIPTPRRAFAYLRPEQRAIVLDWIAKRPQQTRMNMFDLRLVCMAETGVPLGIETMKGALDAAGRKAIWGTRGWQEPDYLAHRLTDGHGDRRSTAGHGVRR